MSDIEGYIEQPITGAKCDVYLVLRGEGGSRVRIQCDLGLHHGGDHAATGRVIPSVFGKVWGLTWGAP